MQIEESQHDKQNFLDRFYTQECLEFLNSSPKVCQVKDILPEGEMIPETTPTTQMTKTPEISRQESPRRIKTIILSSPEDDKKINLEALVLAELTKTKPKASSVFSCSPPDALHRIQTIERELESDVMLRELEEETIRQFGNGSKSSCKKEKVSEKTRERERAMREETENDNKSDEELPLELIYENKDEEIANEKGGVDQENEPKWSSKTEKPVFGIE
jgi:hypothetical protein